MLPKPVLKYVLSALEGTPATLEALSGSYPSISPIWDRRPDPDRFTLREVAAHLADWEAIFHGRIQRILNEDHPRLEDIDEGEIAIEHNYAEIDPHESLRRFKEGRAHLLATLRSVSGEQWERMGHKEMIGDISVEQMAVLILGHDGYHMSQFATYTKEQ